MGLNPEQARNVQRALKVAKRLGASPRETKALVAAMAVESNYRHLSYGDRDSVGVLQQRPSQGWGPAGESVETDVTQFLRAAKKANSGGGSAGQLAQAVQRSAFPGRYDQRGGEAEQLIRRYSRSGTSGGSRGGSGGDRPAREDSYRTVTTPGVDRSGERQAAKLAYLAERGRPGALIGLKQQLDSLADTTPVSRRVRVEGDPSSGRSRGARGGSTRPYEDVAAIEREADRIDAAKVPYLWGGGHSGKQERGSKVTPLDCSGAVSRALGIDPRVSGQFTKFGSPGRAPKGRGVTIYANGEHVLMEINGRFWGTSKSNPGGGAGWIPSSSVSKGYLSRFTARHIKATT